MGDVVDNSVQLSQEGQIAAECWNDLSNHYGHVELDEFVVMPNHVHGIIVMVGTERVDGFRPQRAGLKPAPTPMHSLSEVMRAFKTFSGRRINQIRGRTGEPVWQRNFYERVIRDEKALSEIREYIVNNPAKWAEDMENPRNRP